MNTRSDPPSEEAKGSIRFLESDFNQCFQQIRHYDGQVVGICKFAFIAYSSVITSALGIYKYGLEKTIDLRLPACAIISTGLIICLFFFGLIIRNRIYFVRIVRYINEVRSLFFGHRPMGFENRAGMYTDCCKPKFWNWHSSQLWVSYMLAFLNTTLLGVVLYIRVSGWALWKAIIIILACVACYVMQVILGVVYLKRHDNKSTG